MDRAYTVIENKVVEHTHKDILGYHHTVNLEEFMEYHAEHRYDYLNFKKYLETVTNNVLEDDITVQTGPYGVQVVWDDLTHIVAYNQDDLHYVQGDEDTYFDHTLIELIHRYNTDGWQDVVAVDEIETMVNLYFKDESYITKYKLISWLDLMMNKVREEDFVDELIVGLEQLANVSLQRENTLDGYNISLNDQEIYKVNTNTIKGSRFIYFSELFSVLSDRGAIGSNAQPKQEQAGETLTKAVVTVSRGDRIIDTLRGLNWDDGHQQYRQRVITAVQELTKEGEVTKVTLGFYKNSQHIRMEFSNFDVERKVILVKTIDELSQYGDSELEPYVLNGKEIHQIKMQISSAFNDLI